MFISNENFLDAATLSSDNEQVPYNVANLQQVHRSKLYKPSMSYDEIEVYKLWSDE